MTASACILGCEGTTLSDDERAFFRDVRPWGFILFARNVESLEQTRALTDDLRAAVDDEAALVFVDQEGGRVQRLKPPLARRRPPAARFGALYERDPQTALEAAFLHHRLLAHELSLAGIDADCAPCLDVRTPDGHGVIGDRAFGERASVVAALGRAAVDGLLAGGVAPVVKHIPGHGRAGADSHQELPVVSTALAVLEATDFEPFRALADAPMAMTAHVAYTDVDEACMTLSRHAIGTVIRGLIGFDGLLMSDDLSMRALGGSLADRAGRAIEAGCDVVLHGNGALVGEPARDNLRFELDAVARAAGPLRGRAAERAADARACARGRQPFDPNAAEARLDELGLSGSMAA